MVPHTSADWDGFSSFQYTYWLTILKLFEDLFIDGLYGINLSPLVGRGTKLNQFVGRVALEILKLAQSGLKINLSLFVYFKTTS